MPSSPDTSDAVLSGLDRPGIWELAWQVRGFDSDRPADIRRARAVIRRWEKLTGMSYYGRRRKAR